MISAMGNVLIVVWGMTHVPVPKDINSNQMERAVRISMSVCWEPATAGEESVASTQRAHSVARERSAVEQDMNSLTATTAKILMSVRLASTTVARSLYARTPRGHSVVCPKFSVVLALSKMPLETALI